MLFQILIKQIKKIVVLFFTLYLMIKITSLYPPLYKMIYSAHFSLVDNKVGLLHAVQPLDVCNSSLYTINISIYFWRSTEEGLKPNLAVMFITMS